MLYDYIIIGAGIIGMSIARSLKLDKPDLKILIIDKEEHEACHASGRNSGILHAGFYYSADSLKAKLTVKGNIAWKDYCHKNNLSINESGKLVIAQNEEEILQLEELYKRGQKNGSTVKMVSESEAKELEPNVRTYKKALYSPDTASIDPTKICHSLKKELEAQNVEFRFNTEYIGNSKDNILTNCGDFRFKKLVNCAGLYADKVAHDFGFGLDYTLIPFKGLYLKYTKNKTDIKMNIYPVPHSTNAFLGVHFTKTVDGTIKIGPTAIPSFWRENYEGLDNFKLNEIFQILYYESQLFCLNKFGFRDLAFEEIRKYNKKYFINLAAKMVEHIDPNGFTEYSKPGIRAQLVHKKTLNIVNDFVVEGDDKTVHILNAVSPAFTCALPFADLVREKYL